MNVKMRNFKTTKPKLEKGRNEGRKSCRNDGGGLGCVLEVGPYSRAVP